MSAKAEPHRHVFELKKRTTDQEAAEGGPLTVAWRECACGLAERRRFVDGNIYQLAYRVPGGHDYVPASQMLLLLAALPVRLCPNCAGRDSDSCGLCGGLGVRSENGERIR